MPELNKELEAVREPLKESQIIKTLHKPNSEPQLSLELVRKFGEQKVVYEGVKKMASKPRVGPTKKESDKDCLEFMRENSKSVKDDLVAQQA